METKKRETALSEKERFALWHKGEQEMFITSIEIFYKVSNQSVGGSDDLFYNLADAKNRIQKYVKEIEHGYLNNRTIRLEIRKLDLPLEERKKYCDVQSIFELCDFMSLTPIETMQL